MRTSNDPYALAGLMVITMAGVASADHKPGHNPGGGGGLNSLSPVVRDSNGKLVGTGVQMFQFGVPADFFHVFFGGEFYALRYNQNRVGFPDFSWSISGSHDSLFFTDTLCQTAPAYIFPHADEFQRKFTWVANNTTEVFAPDPSAVIETVRIRGLLLDGTGNCHTTDTNIDVQEATVIFDFAQEFTPPLKMEPQ